MQYLVGFFNHSMFLENPVWRKSKWAWRDIERDRKEIEIFKNDICFYHLRDNKSDKKTLAWYWPPPILWASLRFEGCLNSLHQLPNQLFFESKWWHRYHFCSPLIKILQKTTHANNMNFILLLVLSFSVLSTAFVFPPKKATTSTRRILLIFPHRGRLQFSLLSNN